MFGIESIKSMFKPKAPTPTTVILPPMTPEERREFDEKGFLVIPKALSDERCDEMLKAINDFRDGPNSGPDKAVYNDRIGQIHQIVPECLEAGLNPDVLGKIQTVFEDTPLLFGSLSFDWGTEQSPHIDSIFFYTEPDYGMMGAWYALEDIDPDSGPLFYYPGSHKWPFTRGEEVVRQHPELKEKVEAARKNPESPEARELVAQLGNLWTDDLYKKMEEIGAEKEPAHIKKGDCVLWHSLLVHGGMPRINRELTRKSIVYHYIGLNSRLYTFSDFFLKTNQEILDEQGIGRKVAVHDGKHYIKNPHFSRYNKQGQEMPQYFR